ncbi:DUF2635 domain-containing protein [Acetobacter lovaniensis]|uniref:DUF2635 domain-containing protein n=1 Tax=Acetobacter lovaniensis TaxID=104100 RepID=A0A841QFG0_9PROT|nr:DUF2635 domain-containing protein [Acetobacter lovaniensis]MBB6456984.1 hypothetical protein [Acetobacter lovaniensis]NHN81030.1 DUF2635 domain-containing protein [Acetobacter lovaniensis]GBQ69595.1 hypothetical protein AA0474_1966 [Acetobacter lovaniensis NRIC 0474]
MFVKPAPGRTVRWPASLRLLSEQGAEVPSTAFWLRALACGDVQKASPVVQATATAQSATIEPKGTAA